MRLIEVFDEETGETREIEMRCDRCAWFYQYEQKKNDKFYGQCRKDSPTPLWNFKAGCIEHVASLVYEDYWCSAFASKEEMQTPPSPSSHN